MSPISWTLSGGGDWDTASDWSSKPSLPGPGHQVTINTAATATITHSQNVGDEVSTLDTGAKDTLAIKAGSLTIDSGGTLSGLVTVSGGSLSLGGAITVAGLTQTGGTVNDSGALTLSGPTAKLAVNSGVFNLESGGSIAGGVLSAAGTSAFTWGGGTLSAVT